MGVAFRKWVNRWWPEGADGQELFHLLLFSRLALLAAGWVGLARLPWNFYSPTYNVSPDPLVVMWIRWDALWYTGIAVHGYWSQALTFFPLYPLLIAGVHWITFLPIDVAALVVSNAAMVAYLVVLFRLVAETYNRELAVGAASMALLFPTAFFLSAAYTESLFLFLSVSAFWAARRRRFWWAALWGGLATLTRNEGVFLVIPMLWAYYKEYGWTWRRPLWSVLAIPAALGAFMVYQWADFGNPLAFVHAQAYWGRHITWPWVGIFLALKAVWSASPLQAEGVLSMIDLVAALSSMALWVYSWRHKLPFDWMAYWGILLIIDVSAPDPSGQSPLLSMSRLVLILFPAYVALAMLARRPSWKRFLHWMLPMLQVAFFLVFATWHWIA